MDPRPEPLPVTYGRFDTRDAPPPKHFPYDIQIEQALLGAMLADNRQIDVAAAELEAEHFYEPLHARLFNAIVYLVTEGSVSPLELNSAVKADPGLIEVGGVAYLATMCAAAPAMPNVKDYCKILRDLAAKRALITIGEDMVSAAQESPIENSARNIADKAADALLDIGAANARVRRSAHQIAMETVSRLERAAQGVPLPFVKTGLEKVDEEIGGLKGGDLIVILGKSGMGKSALMGGACLNTARNGVPTLVFSLEMTADQWVERMVCDLEFDGLNKPLWYSRVRNGLLNEGEFDRFMLSSRRLEGLPLEIIDDASVSMQQITARARAFKAKHRGKLGVVLIDYLQIVEPADARDNRERQVNSIARGAKALAKMLDWPVVVGSQMNEGDTARAKEERRPQPSDARESKGIQHEADLMLAPYRPAYWVEIRKPLDVPPGSPDWVKWTADLKAVRNRFELLTLKNRHGRKRDFELWAEMGASAIRNQEPIRPRQAEDDAARDLLEGI